MDVINRLKSAVTNVLPVGNPITNEFDILGQRASGGPALLWKVYDAVQRSTKQARLCTLTNVCMMSCFKRISCENNESLLVFYLYRRWPKINDFF